MPGVTSLMKHPRHNQSTNLESRVGYDYKNEENDCTCRPVKSSSLLYMYPNLVVYKSQTQNRNANAMEYKHEDFNATKAMQKSPSNATDHRTNAQSTVNTEHRSNQAEQQRHPMSNPVSPFNSLFLPGYAAQANRIRPGEP